MSSHLLSQLAKEKKIHGFSIPSGGPVPSVLLRLVPEVLLCLDPEVLGPRLSSPSGGVLRSENLPLNL
jgi:hypothetical protein